LTIEYDQATAGTGDTVQAGVLDALDRVESDMDNLIAQSPWLGAAQTVALHDAIKTVRTAGETGVDPSAFAQIAATAAGLVRNTFGAPAP
jgi:hypothetical protein